ncbi:hypothetical protein [Micromonospora taraxaci]|uniref:hypothetical protein n=1 Tax=Micromonospora taraxaci TaxID=1316803 RepID=UPI0033B7C5F3
MDELIANMERFGRYTFKPLGQHDDPNEIWHDLIGPLLPIAQADPDAFVTRLNRAVASTEGWAVYGAAHAIIELLGGDFRHPAAGELMHRSLQFLRSRGVPELHLTGYEREFWARHHGRTEPWLVGRPRPTLQEAPITEPKVGEQRLLMRISPEPDSNLVLLSHGGDGYLAVIDARYSDDNPARSRRDWKTARRLDDLYWDIGTVSQIPTFWCDSELEPYFPLPPPRLQ